MAKATGTTPREPTETGVKRRSLLSTAHSRSFVVVKQVFHFNLEAGSQTSCVEELAQEQHTTPPRVPRAHSLSDGSPRKFTAD